MCGPNAQHVSDSPRSSGREYSDPVTPELLQTALLRALATIAEARGARLVSPEVRLRRRTEGREGEWSSTLALHTAGSMNMEPHDLAEAIAEMVAAHPCVAAVTVSGPGFLNISLTRAARGQVAVDIVSAGSIADPADSEFSRIESFIDSLISSGAEPDQAEVLMSNDASRLMAVDGMRRGPRIHDGNLLRKGHWDNPVYRLQFAHAEAHRVRRRAVAAGVDSSGFDPEALSDSAEVKLLNALADYPRTVSAAASKDEPERIRDLVEAVAELLVSWTQTTVITPSLDEPITTLHASRLVLDRAAIIVLAAGLRLMGLSAPERM